MEFIGDAIDLVEARLEPFVVSREKVQGAVFVPADGMVEHLGEWKTRMGC